MPYVWSCLICKEPTDCKRLDFDSYVQGKQLEESDLDFIIEIDKPLAKNYFGLWTYLEKRFGKKIYLVRKGDHIGSNFMRTIERDIIYV